MKLNWKFWRGEGGGQSRKPSVGVKWLFSGTTHLRDSENHLKET